MWPGQASNARPLQKCHIWNCFFAFSVLFFFVYLPKIGDVNATLKKCHILKLFFCIFRDFLPRSPKIRRRWLLDKVNCFGICWLELHQMLQWNGTLLGLIFIDLEIACVTQIADLSKKILSAPTINTEKMEVKSRISFFSLKFINVLQSHQKQLIF